MCCNVTKETEWALAPRWGKIVYTAGRWQIVHRYRGPINAGCILWMANPWGRKIKWDSELTLEEAKSIAIRHDKYETPTEAPR